MNLHGKQIIGLNFSNKGDNFFYAINPATGENIKPIYYEGTKGEINSSLLKAKDCFILFKFLPLKIRVKFLKQIANEIGKVKSTIIKRCHEETALPIERLKNELTRTLNQINLFAKILKEGSFFYPRIDNPDFRPDIRQTLIPIGPVGIFGASNFPLAFSVAGGDTISALAAGCPVIFKAHPAHPGTSELVGRTILKASKITNIPEGIFSLIHGVSHRVGINIVNHPNIKAIGFTGSFKGGKTLFDLAVRRPNPIPVYAEMGSTNPIFILPNALNKSNSLAKNLVDSITLGVGQFCTNPGLIFILNKAPLKTKKFLNIVKELITQHSAGTMLTQNIHNEYEDRIAGLKKKKNISLLAEGKGDNQSCGIARIFLTKVKEFLKNPYLENEIFGPSTIILTANTKKEFYHAVHKLTGHLTATIHCTGKDDKEVIRSLSNILKNKVGRLIMNGFPTGVEVCHAMHHGGPYPVTTDLRSTSVGTAAISRFLRPLCYQNFPQYLLPDELKNTNPLNIYRLINGRLTKNKIP